MDGSLSVPSPLVAFLLVDVSLALPGPDWVLEVLVAFLVSVLLSVLDLASLVALPLVDVSLSVSGEYKPQEA